MNAKTMNAKASARQSGLSLLEVLAIVAVISVVDAIILSRVNRWSTSGRGIDRDGKAVISDTYPLDSTTRRA